MTSITWAGPRCVHELATILAPQNRTQGRCERVWYFDIYEMLFWMRNSSFINRNFPKQISFVICVAVGVYFELVCKLLAESAQILFHNSHLVFSLFTPTPSLHSHTEEGIQTANKGSEWGNVWLKAELSMVKEGSTCWENNIKTSGAELTKKQYTCTEMKHNTE